MGSREREVKVVILGEDKGGAKALKQVDDAAAKLGPTGKIAENALQGVTSKLTSGLGPAGGQAQAALDKVGASALSSGNLLTTALGGGALIAGAGLAALAIHGVTALVDLAGEVRNFGRATGLSAEDSSRMVSVLDDLGISSEVGGAAMFKLAKNVGDGGEKLAKYGVEVARTKDGNLDLMGTLLNVADAYTKTQDQGKRAELVMAAFGKAGQNLIPILEKGRDGIQEMFDAVKRGEILTQKQIDDTRRFELAIDDVQDSFRSLAIQGGSALLPYITTVTEAGTKTLDFIDNALSRQGGVKGLFDNIVSAGLPAVGLLKAFGLGNDDAGDKAKGAAAKFDLEVLALAELGVEVSDTERATGELTAETKKAAAEAEKYKTKIDSMAAGIQVAYRTTGRAADELTQEHRDLARGFDTAKSAADQLKAGLDILTGVKINATRAAITWEERIRSTSETLRENKRTLDITTEAGRENTTAIFDMVQAGFAHVEALQREGASSEAVTAAYGDHVAALRRVMEQAGYSREEIEALLGRYNLLAGAPDISKNIDIYTTYYSHNTVAQEEGVGYAGIQKFARGLEAGPVRGRPGQAIPVLAHAGERFITDEQIAALRGSGSAGGDGAAYGPSGGAIVLGPGAIVVYALDPKSAALGVRDELVRYGKRANGTGIE